MAFVAGTNLVLGAGVVVPLPLAIDAGGNNQAFTLYSHMRVPGGTTYTFDNGVTQAVAVGTDSVFPIPPGARSIVAIAASSAELGQMQ